jgi:hypothetical protein
MVDVIPLVSQHRVPSQHAAKKPWRQVFVSYNRTELTNEL